MTVKDPGFEIIKNTAKGGGFFIGILGIITLGGSLVISYVIIKSMFGNSFQITGNFIAGIIATIPFLLAGFFMIRSWIFKPHAAKFLNLLTINSSELVAYDIEYVSMQGRYAIKEALPDPYLVLYTKDKQKYIQCIDHKDLKIIESYVANIAHKVKK